MLQITDGAITETIYSGTGVVSMTVGSSMAGLAQASNCLEYNGWPYQTYWQHYPVYVCLDKTKKAIEVLKALQAEKLLKCDSVPRFIELVEKISGLL